MSGLVDEHLLSDVCEILETAVGGIGGRFVLSGLEAMAFYFESIAGGIGEGDLAGLRHAIALEYAVRSSDPVGTGGYTIMTLRELAEHSAEIRGARSSKQAVKFTEINVKAHAKMETMFVSAILKRFDQAQLARQR